MVSPKFEQIYIIIFELPVNLRNTSIWFWYENHMRICGWSWRTIHIRMILFCVPYIMMESPYCVHIVLRVSEWYQSDAKNPCRTSMYQSLKKNWVDGYYTVLNHARPAYLLILLWDMFNTWPLICSKWSLQNKYWAKPNIISHII